MPTDPDNLDPRIVAKIVATFEDAAKRIRERIITPPGKSASAQAWNQSQAAVQIAQIEQIVSALKKEAASWTGGALSDSFKQGITHAQKQLQDAGVDLTPRESRGANLRGSFAVIDRKAVEIFARDTMGDLTKAADSLGRRAGTTLRQMAAIGVSRQEVNDILAGSHIIEGRPVAAIRELRELLRGVHGNTVQIRDKNGDPMEFKVGYYAEMVARTKTREAVVKARHETLKDAGIDLVKIVGRKSKYFCTAFLGHVYSISGNHPKYPPLSSLPGGGPPFHPNCSKSTAPFVEALASDASLRNAEPGPEAQAVAAAGDTTKAQRIFRETHESGAAAKRQREIVGDIRQRARDNGQPDQPNNGIMDRPEGRERTSFRRSPTAATSPRNVAQPPSAVKVAPPAPRTVAQPPSSPRAVAPSRNLKPETRNSTTTEKLRQQLAALRARNAEARAKLLAAARERDALMQQLEALLRQNASAGVLAQIAELKRRLAAANAQVKAYESAVRRAERNE